MFELEGGLMLALTRAPSSRRWGIYSGYFRDLDGHLWQIIWNPRRVISDT
jgi:predicted lactoylglutathione lyase